MKKWLTLLAMTAGLVSTGNAAYINRLKTFTGVASQWPWQLNTDGTWTLKQPSFGDMSAGLSTILPSVSVTGSGQSVLSDTAFGLQTTYSSNTTPSHLLHVDLTAAGTGGISGDTGNVAAFIGATNNSTGGNLWALNTLTTIKPGSTTGDVPGVEIDLNNFAAARGATPGPTGLGPPVSYGVEVSGVGSSSYANTSAFIAIAEPGVSWASPKQWFRGFTAYGVYGECGFCDYTASPAGFSSWGIHDYLIDAANATINTAIINHPKMAIGVDGSMRLGSTGAANGALLLANGSGGGAYTWLRGISATSAYYFNLPATAGTSGTVLTSAGGGSSPMTWTTLAASATTDTTNASNISSGTLAAARGGAGTITGALKGNGSGVVSQAACADLSNGSTGCSAATGTSGHTLPFLDGANTWSADQTFTGYIAAPFHLSTGSASLASCGTSPSIDALSTQASGSFTTGTGSPTACTVNFGAIYPSTSFCTIAPANAAASGAGGYISLNNAGGFIVTMTATSSAKFNYVCMGR